MRKSLSIFLMTILLVNVFGPVMATHHCGGEIVEMYLGNGVPQLGCGMESEEGACPSQDDDSLAQESCCHDNMTRGQVEVLQSVDIKLLDSASFEFIDIPVLIEFFGQTIFDRIDFFTDLSPPPVLSQDVIIVFQVFRI